MQIYDKQIDLHEYLRIIMKHRWTILTVFAVIVISVVIYSFTATPIYRATTRLIIEKETPKVVSVQEVMSVDSSGTDYYQTQYKIIESRAVAREVIKRLKLDENEEFVPKRKDNFIAAIWYSITDSIAYLRSLLKTEKPQDADESILYEENSPLITQFIKRIEVKPIRNSRLVDVSFEAKDPLMSAKIANGIARSYIDLSLQTKLKATQDAVSWLNSQVELERKKVEAAEQALLKYKEQHGIITDFTSNVETITAQKLAELNKQVVESEAKRVEAETRYRQASALEKTPEMLDSVPEVLSNLLIQEIKKQEVELFKRRSELSKKYGQNHPQIIALNKELDTLHASKLREVKRVVSALYNEYRVASAREQSLKASLGRQKGESLSLNQKAIDYSVLKRDAESAKEMYDLLIKRFKEASLTEDIKTGNIRVVDPAEVPKSPVKPKKTQNILLALVVGLSLGVGLAFFLEYLDNTVKTPEEIKHYFNIPFLGPIPAIASDQGDGNPGNPVVRKPEEDLVTINLPKSSASESYRGIRTSIQFSSANSTPRVILVSSSGPAEGKTITAANLAITMAQAGNKVAILDCDMRRPRIHRLFNIVKDRGLSNVLVGNCEVHEAILHTEVPNVDIIPSGPIPPNPSEILGSPQMVSLVEHLKNDYERIIIDSPPISAVTDAVILSQYVDGVLLVIRAGETPREIVRNGISQLQSVNARILGAVLNDVEMGRDTYYYYQYYYYYYGEDGERRRKVRPEERLREGYKDMAQTAILYGGKLKEKLSSVRKGIKERSQKRSG
ncbi:MAG: polysaccharide biosynthesis tyrosine autokinase [Deltaproteobacteria bacterium]|nr:polysaccharide biosynthesis tyrosine autokinase [Deltaproteobacteria bacterium]